MRDVLLLALPVACVSWTIVEAEITRDLREWLKGWACRQGRGATRAWLCRKLAYLPTCAYCSSHYVALAALALSPVHILNLGWQGLVLGWLSVVGVSTVYLTFYQLLRVLLRWCQVKADAARPYRKEPS